MTPSGRGRPWRGGVAPSVLLLADDSTAHAATILDHIAALTEFSRADWYVYNPRDVSSSRLLDLGEFDAVVIHYSLVIIADTYLDPSFRRKLHEYRGLKIQFIQDDYRWVDRMTEMMRYLGIDVLFTLVPSKEIPKVWREDRLPGVRKINTLAGYVPDNLLGRDVPRIGERPIDVGYRGRTLPYWLGKLGQEKALIAQQFAERAVAYGLRCDIGWRETDRVYGGDWITFISSCRVTLGTESGSSITDFDGSLDRRVTDYLRDHPDASFDDVFERILAPYEGNVAMNVISPRIFEAIALRTPLVLYPGEYMGVIEPWRHYIPLEKDFSNMDDVVARIRDTKFLEEMAARAYDEIALSGKYSFRAFVAEFDAVLDESIKVRGRASKLRYRLALLEPNPRLVKQKIKEALVVAERLGQVCTVARLLASHPDLGRLWRARRTAPGPVRARALLKDLLRLSAIRKVRDPETGTTFPFDISLEVDGARQTLIFRSARKATEGEPPADIHCVSEAHLRSLLETRRVTRILFDHTAVGNALEVRLSWFERMSFEMGDTGIFDLACFAAIAMANPALGARVIMTTMAGTRPEDVEASATAMGQSGVAPH